MTNKKKRLIDAIMEQSQDTGLQTGQEIVSGMEDTERDIARTLSHSVGNDLVRTIRLFSSDGDIGRALSRIAPSLAGVPGLRIPTLDFLSGADGDIESLVAALFDPGFQKSLYGFQLLLSRSDLDAQQKLVKRFSQINWAKFNSDDQGWFAKTLSLISAGVERGRAYELNLQDVIPLMKVPHVLDIITLSSGYAEMMNAAMAAYIGDRDFLMRMGDDNNEILGEIDVLLERIKRSEASRLARLDDIVSATDRLKKLMEVATLVADLTNRTAEAEAQKKAGETLARALHQHSQDTLESQEAYLQQFMRLNQILISNQVREGRLESAMAALGLYVKSYQAFVLMLTCLQVYLLTASSVLKTYMKDSIEGSSRLVASQLYITKVDPLRTSVLKYSSGFARIKPGQSQRPGTIKIVPNHTGEGIALEPIRESEVVG